VTATEKNYIGALNDQLKGNVVLYSEMHVSENTGLKDLKACFYRLDTKKQYCPTEYAAKTIYDQGFNSFDGNYHLWKSPGGPIAKIRDLTCYCEKEGICPFEE
jgi:hypothetical protein